MASSTSVPSQNSDWTRSTAIVQLSASVSECSAKLLPFYVIPALSVVVVASFSASSDFCAVARHLLRCSALTPNAPPER